MPPSAPCSCCSCCGRKTFIAVRLGTGEKTLPLVLAIEPDLRQAAIIKRVIREKVHADLVLVDSRDGAMAALAAGVPDVVLLTSLLSPRDEEELIRYLRSLDGAEHLQTHTIPQLASRGAGAEPHGEAPSTGLLRRFRRKKEAEQIHGCDPELFAAEVRAFLERAAELKSESAGAPAGAPGVTPVRAMVELAAEAATPALDPSSAWSSPFEWRRSEPTHGTENPDLETPRPKREPLVTTLPLAVIAEEEERRHAGAQAAEAERLRAEAAEAEAEAERARTQAAAEKAKAEAERERLEVEAKAKRERLRVLAEAEAKAKAEADAKARLEVEAAAKAERERLRLHSEAEMKARADAAAKAKAEADAKLRMEAEAAARAEVERSRVAAEAAAIAKAEAEAQAAFEAELATKVPEDAFADFREENDGERGIFRLMPLAMWARRELPPQPAPEPVSNGELHDLLAHFALPPHVAGVTYARGCRIRRVRVPALSAPSRTHATHPVILSKRALDEMRAGR